MASFSVGLDGRGPAFLYTTSQKPSRYRLNPGAGRLTTFFVDDNLMTYSLWATKCSTFFESAGYQTGMTTGIVGSVDFAHD